MTRCRTRAAQAARWLGACSLAISATLVGPALLLAVDAAQSATSSGYPPRKLAPQSLRGELQVVAAPEALLNGQGVRLAPGARIHGQDNMLVMSGRAAGQKLAVNYTADTYGLVMEVWILRPEELAQRWPTTLQEASTWLFEPQTQTWTKP
jgi:hypothetical protein